MKERKNTKANWGNLLELFQQHIEEVVAQQVQERLEVIKQEQQQKLFYSLGEAEEILGITRSALKKRHRRGTLQLHYYNCNTLLMPAEELERLVSEIRKAG